MTEFSFITRIPNEPGTLHKVAKIAKIHNANIHRIHYNYKIDPSTVFFEISSSKDAYEKIKNKLEELGYLQTSLEPLQYLKFNIFLPNRPGALFEFLDHITSTNANIGFMDFDEKSNRHDQLTISLTLENTTAVHLLLENLKRYYPMEVLEYDAKGKKLDETVFYLRFAQKIREIIGTEDEFLLKLLNDINHIVQELTRLGEDPKKVFQSIIATGNTLKNTQGNKFFADVQIISLTDDSTIYCIQPPCGGNIYIVESRGEMIMIDSGYGIYHLDIIKLFQHYGINFNQLQGIYITHADADHSGASGLYNVKSYLHEGTLSIIDKTNRAYGSTAEECVLEEVYTKLINLFSKFNPPTHVEVFPDKIIKMRGEIPVISSFKVGDMTFEVLQSLGGHLYGQVFFVCPQKGLLFTSDSLINFESLTPDRKQYNILAKNLMTSVNVDTERAKEERNTLIKLISSLNEELLGEGKECLICSGHGAISVFDGNKMKVKGEIHHYVPDS